MTHNPSIKVHELPTAESVLAHFADHTLLNDLIHWQAHETTAATVDIAVGLHNGGQLDLLAVADWPEWAEVTGHAFFSAQHFFIAAIPLLEAETDRMLGFVAALVAKGGEDLAANQPNVALTTWFESHRDQTEAVVSKAASGELLAVDHLSFALQALGDRELARSVVLSSDGLSRLSALTGLVRTPHDTPEDREKTVAVLESLLPSDDDRLRASVIDGVVNVFSMVKTELTADALAVIQMAVDGAGDITLYSAARSLFANNAILNRDLIGILLPALLALNPSQKGTVNYVDLGLSEMVRHGYGDEAVDFLTELLTTSGESLSVDEFDSFGSALFEVDRKTIQHLVAKWLLSGIPQLCKGAEHLFSRAGMVGQPVSIDLSGEGLSDEEAYFVCRKAVGFFFMQPVVASSAIVSLMRGAPDDWASAMEDLLFDPLLVNYGGAVNDFLAGLPPDNPAYERVQRVIGRGETYLKGLRSVGDIKEIQPSEQHRLLERVRFGEQMNKAMKGAQKESVFHGLFKRSTLLYGNRSVSFVEGPGGERRRFEMELQSHGITQEWPRTETIDPVGLQETLFVLRVEQRRR